MHLNPYGEYAVLLAASLANDWPPTRGGIVERTRDFGMTMETLQSPDDHGGVRVIIDDWLEVVDAATESKRARHLNMQMAAVAAYPRLTDHNGEGWHLHYRDADQPLPQVLLAVISVGTALHLTTRGMKRLGRCAGSTATGGLCTRVIVDTTRNGRQQYCSVRCANRAATQRHRAKTKQKKMPPPRMDRA